MIQLTEIPGNDSVMICGHCCVQAFALIFEYP